MNCHCVYLSEIHKCLIFRWDLITWRSVETEASVHARPVSAGLSLQLAPVAVVADGAHAAELVRAGFLRKEIWLSSRKTRWLNWHQIGRIFAYWSSVYLLWAFLNATEEVQKFGKLFSHYVLIWTKINLGYLHLGQISSQTHLVPLICMLYSGTCKARPT
jgi:hypothetical protein